MKIFLIELTCTWKIFEGLTSGFSLTSTIVVSRLPILCHPQELMKKLFPTLLLKQGPKMNTPPWPVGMQTCTTPIEINMVVPKKIGN